jgi:hypothetical protein
MSIDDVLRKSESRAGAGNTLGRLESIKGVTGRLGRHAGARIRHGQDQPSPTRLPIFALATAKQ